MSSSFRSARQCPPGEEKHRAGVARLAESLACRFGVRGRDVRMAASLHDLFKEVPGPALGRMLRALRIRLDRATLRAPAIWHGPAAEAYARRRLGVRRRNVLSAIRWHTTGRSGQGTLERILFVADFCEPGREFPEAGRARALARRSLRVAARYVMACKMAHLREEGIPAHPASIAMWRELTCRMR